MARYGSTAEPVEEDHKDADMEEEEEDAIGGRRERQELWLGMADLQSPSEEDHHQDADMEEEEGAMAAAGETDPDQSTYLAYRCLFTLIHVRLTEHRQFQMFKF
nr:hypothetical protein BaRGS_024386 [Batillaria attramentaria]